MPSSSILPKPFSRSLLLLPLQVWYLERRVTHLTVTEDFFIIFF